MTKPILIDDLDPGSRDSGVPAHFGDPVREQRLLANEVGIVDRSHRGIVAVPGADRLSWLHDISTQHLTALAAGQGTRTLFLSPHGHVEHVAGVTEDGGTTWLDVEPGDQAPLLDFLNRMRFLLRVEPQDVTAEWALLSLVGPAAAQVLDLAPARVGEVPGPKFAAGTVPPLPTSVYAVTPAFGGWARRDGFGIDLVVPRASADAVIEKLDVPRAGLWAYEAMRVEARRARQGLETDHKTLPAEVDLIADGVHLEKGCYRGQETVARVHNLGRPPRRLALLHLDGIASDELPAAGTPVTSDGRAVGFVGTAVRHHELGQIALAVVKRNISDEAPLLVGESSAAIDPD
ncbi:CAF17-like 4Fe-4S cluster assembly/insertion protein YgfZ [Hamadaea tsunoensis]|uniref:CAF17-like 4Fe-4S cluster assembly/insertion protein YgfZ n=1 Tax=Hamadaea tsunoensis TaxID=53368 RepID=UPI0003FD94C1|nr:folate-binding protein YgfZ [Hamadaea tsunoensis]